MTGLRTSAVTAVVTILSVIGVSPSSAFWLSFRAVDPEAVVLGLIEPFSLASQSRSGSASRPPAAAFGQVQLPLRLPLHEMGGPIEHCYFTDGGHDVLTDPPRRRSDDRSGGSARKDLPVPPR
jgi:hypothetical protein